MLGPRGGRRRPWNTHPNMWDFGLDMFRYLTCCYVLLLVVCVSLWLSPLLICR